MKETNARPETLLPATLICTSKPTSKEANDGMYEVTIPLIYMAEAMKNPAQFYKFLFKGLRYDERKTIHPRQPRRTKKSVS